MRLGQIKERLEKMGGAEEAYLIALELESNHGLVYLGLGRVQSKLGRVKEALKSVEKSIALMEEDYRPYMVRGDIYFSLGDYERADSKGYSKAVHIRPDFKRGWRKLTKVYRAQDNRELLIMALSRIRRSIQRMKMLCGKGLRLIMILRNSVMQWEISTNFWH